MDNPKLKLDPKQQALDSATSADEYREPTKQELLDDLRIALRDAIIGEEGIPAREGLEAMRRRIYGDADQS